MKIFINNSLLIMLLLLSSISGYADPPAPLPDPPPTDTPIDENLVILLFTAILFGIRIIYSRKLNSKI
ncbi:hypothetical protein [Flavobacterium sp. N3904]|uniref:hypothetical protein n=1 Tax=Flavobacterium sp. N3904 TaxID=2986835 RepID=UPI00222443E2|nr:hypothetical protein [Flavobacterium sp. N3904]